MRQVKPSVKANSNTMSSRLRRSIPFSFLLCMLALASMPISVEAAEAGCTCTYITRAIHDTPSGETAGTASSRTSVVITSDSSGVTAPITNTASCRLGCTEWADHQSSLSSLFEYVIDGDPVYRTAEEAAATTAAAVAEAEAREYLYPDLNVDVPGLTFAEVLDVNGLLHINFIPEYLNGLYRYALGAGAIIAVVMVMIGGAQYMIGSGMGSVEAGRKRITNAITGLILVLSAYTILNVVNPNITFFEPLALKYVKASPFIVAEGAEAIAGCQDIKGIVAKCSKETLISTRWTSSVTESINAIGKDTGVDPLLISTHLQVEGAKTDLSWVTGQCGEIGPAQFMPTTFDGIVESTTRCCTRVARNGGILDRDRTACTATTDSWPPPSSEFPNCNTEKCSNCQVADPSCVAYMTLSSTNTGAVENAIRAEALFIKTNLTKITGDYALAMCAYNGRGANAAAYAQKAAAAYTATCTASGGSN